MTMPLDRAVWSSLTTVHTHLSEGDDLARRYDRQVNLWAAARDDSPAALDRLASLAEPGGSIYVAEAAPIAVPDGMELTRHALGVQMLDTGKSGDDDAQSDIVPLGDEDAADMLALATLTDPGPFLARTHTMGNFCGVRVGGQLIAMAGERLRVPGYTEISGVCSHPDYRGRGYGSRLIRHVMAGIRARGETPFLHAWKTNETAIRLYESLGFAHRRDINVAVLTRPTVA